MFELNSKNLQTKEKIGFGTTSVVYAYNEDNNIDKCVIKHIHVNSSDELRKQMQNITLGTNHDHPYIIPIKHCIQEEGREDWNIYIKMPRMKGNLADMLEECRKTKRAICPKDQVIQYLFCLSSALEYLERKGIYHGNIKPSNVLVDKSGKAYLSDIRMEKAEDNTTEKNTSTTSSNKDNLIYTAPEVLNKKGNSRRRNEDIAKSDAWSLGMIIMELCASKPLDNTINMPEKEKRAVIGQTLIEIEKNYGEELSNILSGLLTPEPNQRKSFAATRKSLKEYFPNVTEVIQKDVERKFINIMDSETKKTMILEENDTSPIYDQVDKIIKPPAEEAKFYLRSLKLWIFPAFLGILLGILMTCTLYLPIRTNSTLHNFKTENLDIEDRTSRILEVDCPGIRGIQPIDDENEIGVDIFVELNDSDDELENFDEDHFNNTANALRAKWGRYFDFLEENDTLYIGPVDVSKIYDDTVNNLLIDIAETRKRFNPESLEKIDFDLSWCKEITDATITHLAYHFSHYLKELKSLRMIFWKCDQITDDGLELLGEIISKNLRNLEILKLDFEGCTQIGDTGIATLGFYLKQRPDKLKALSLNFRACPRITDAGIGHLGYHLSFFTNLEELRLPLSSCPKITDEGVKQISTYIGQNLVKLKLLVFNVGRSGLITDRGLGYFSWNIFKNLKELEELWMNFEYSAITDEGIQQFSSSISQYGTGIQKLDLRFVGCSRLKEDGFKHLGLGIGENLKDLKQLKLFVGKDKQISEEVKKQVREALSFIPELECVGCE